MSFITKRLFPRDKKQLKNNEKNKEDYVTEYYSVLHNAVLLLDAQKKLIDTLSSTEGDSEKEDVRRSMHQTYSENLEDLKTKFYELQKDFKDSLKRLEESPILSSGTNEASATNDLKDSESSNPANPLPEANTVKPNSTKSPGVLQIFYVHEGQMIKEIESDLFYTLNAKLQSVSFQKCQSASDIDPSKMVIVLYIVTTRVGADAWNAIKDIQCLENAILLLIHYKESHSLSGLNSASYLVDDQFKRLRGILDLAFVTDIGFHHCEMNEKSFTTLTSLCREFVNGDTL